jgi:hypothetical protein
MRAEINEWSGVVVPFPAQRSRARAVQFPADAIVPAAARGRRCIVLPLRRAQAAKRAVLLVNLRRLSAEIQALKASDAVLLTDAGCEHRDAQAALASPLK